MKYEFRYIIKMTNGKKYDIITNFHKGKDVLKYIDSHDYIELFDRKIEEMVAVKSEYVMSALYKDSKRIDSEGNTDVSAESKEEAEEMAKRPKGLLEVVPSSFNSCRSISKPIPDRKHATPPRKDSE